MPVSCEVYVDCAAIGLETHKLKRKSANAIPQQFRKPRSKRCISHRQNLG